MWFGTGLKTDKPPHGNSWLAWFKTITRPHFTVTFLPFLVNVCICVGFSFFFFWYIIYLYSFGSNEQIWICSWKGMKNWKELGEVRGYNCPCGQFSITDADVGRAELFLWVLLCREYTTVLSVQLALPMGATKMKPYSTPGCCARLCLWWQLWRP